MYKSFGVLLIIFTNKLERKIFARLQIIFPFIIPVLHIHHI